MEVSITNNPLGIPEILLHVLNYVSGSNSRDLIPCRLVNRNWSIAATELLKKKGICISLNNDSIQPYRELLEKCQLERRSHDEELGSVHQGGRQPLDKLNCIIQMPKYGSSSVPQRHIGNLSRFHPMVNEVQILIGAYNCAIDGIVDTHNLIGDPSFCQLLQLTSSTLKTLYLEPKRKDSMNTGSQSDSSSSESSDEDGAEEKDTVQIPASFPKLSCVKYVVQDLRELEAFPMPKLLNKLVASAPTLQTLIVRGDYIPFQFRDDGSLLHDQSVFVTEIIGGLVQPNNEIPLRLTNLELTIYNDVSLYSLCDLVLPKLRNLKIHQRRTCMCSRSFCTFLAKKCPCLDALDLFFLPFCKSPRSEDGFDRLDSSNPEIHQITHVGLYLGTTLDSIEAEENSAFHKAAMITSAANISLQFPCLTSIGSDLYGLGSLTFARGNYYQERTVLPANLQSIYSTINFPHVSSLSISLSCHQTFLSLNYGTDDSIQNTDGNFETEEDVVRLITAYVESIFPSLTKFVVTHEDDEDALDFYLTNLLRNWGMKGWIRNSGLKSILRMNGPGIQTLEVNNYFEWFKFLVEDDDENTLNNLWQSVTHLKFGRDTRKRRQRAGIKNTSPCNILDIHFEHFPNLESIHIQEEIVTESKRNGKSVPFENVLDELNVFRASHPNIIIQLC